MSPVAICGTDTPLDITNRDVNYMALGLARSRDGRPGSFFYFSLAIRIVLGFAAYGATHTGA